MSLKEIEEFLEFSPYVELTHKADLEPVTDYPIADNCMAMIVGATGSGKSYVLGEMFKRVHFDIIFFISPTASFDQTRQNYPCDWFITYDNPNEGVDQLFDYLLRRIQIAHLLGVINEYDELDLINRGKVMEEIDKVADGMDYEFFRMTNRIAVVLDDCGYQTKEMKGQQTPLSKLIMIRRHLGISVFLALQSYTQVAKEIRRQASDVILTKAISTEDYKNIFHELTNLPKKEIIKFPRHFTGLITTLTDGKIYSSVHFLHRGCMCDFNPVDENQIRMIVSDIS